MSEAAPTDLTEDVNFVRRTAEGLAKAYPGRQGFARFVLAQAFIATAFEEGMTAPEVGDEFDAYLDDAIERGATLRTGATH